jgi:hypothetical protein
MATHFEDKHRQGEHETNPEPPGHVVQFVVRPLFRGHLDGFERHATDRAAAGAYLTDLRMHRAGVDGTGPHRSGLDGCRRLGLQIALLRAGGIGRARTLAVPAVGYDGLRRTIIGLVLTHSALQHGVINTTPTESVRIGNYSARRRPANRIQGQRRAKKLYNGPKIRAKNQPQAKLSTRPRKKLCQFNNSNPGRKIVSMA